MSFQKEDLTKDEEFFSDAKDTPTNVRGSGQTVYWRSCSILVYKAGDTQKSTAAYSTCDGQGTVNKDTWLWFGGKGGKVKED
ncbi:hypothetical protein VTG60DRAFT_3113 [Thermothelomyces hinnuleus]